jgi:hypothetical protein
MFRDSELTTLRQQMSQLTADFKYNLKLLKDRDTDMEQIEGELVAAKETIAAKDTVRSGGIDIAINVATV